MIVSTPAANDSANAGLPRLPHPRGSQEVPLASLSRLPPALAPISYMYVADSSQLGQSEESELFQRLLSS